jgi:hypothetical protein
VDTGSQTIALASPLVPWETKVRTTEAIEETDTVPAKFSEQNAADDKLSIAAYTFKLLTEEQRRAIYTALKGQPAGPAFNADIGVELPSSVELRPMPDDVVARVQQTKELD